MLFRNYVLVPVELFERLEIQEYIHVFSILEKIFFFIRFKAKSLNKGRVQKKKKKKVGNFPLGGGGPENFENFSHFILFIFKHGLNHPEMKRNFFQKLVPQHPHPFPPPVGNFPTCF